MNHTLTHSGVQIAKEIIKPIQTYVHSGDITSTENSTLKDIRSFMRVENN